MNPASKLFGAAILGCSLLAPLALGQSQPADAGQAAPADAAPADAGQAAPAGVTAPGVTAPENPGAWLLGRSYIELDASIDKFMHAPGASTGASPGLGFNIPVADYFDIGSHYAYEHAANTAFKLDDNTWDTDFTVYDKVGWIAPFASVGVGYEWRRGLSQGVFTREDSALYDAAVGFEVPVSDQTSIRATLEHDYDFSTPHLNSWDYGVSANAWVNEAVGTFVGADWRNGYAGAKSGILFTAGIRISFDSQ